MEKDVNQIRMSIFGKDSKNNEIVNDISNNKEDKIVNDISDTKEEDKINYQFKPDEALKNAMLRCDNNTKIDCINNLFGTNISYSAEISDQPTEFIEKFPNLDIQSMYRADLIFKDDNTGIIYHIEFQSTPDKTMAYRIIMYQYLYLKSQYLDKGIYFDSDSNDYFNMQSVVIYTYPNKPKSGVDTLKIMRDVTVNGVYYKNAKIEFNVNYINLLKFSDDELEALYPNTYFIKFYKYLKDKKLINSNDGVKNFLSMEDNYIKRISEFNSDDFYVNLSAFIDIKGDVKAYIDKNPDISKEVKDMFDRKETTYERLMRERQEMLVQGIYNEKVNVILNLHNSGMDTTFISSIVDLPTAEIERIINQHMQPTS